MGLIESWNNYHNRVGESIGGLAGISAENNVIMGAVVPALCTLASTYPNEWAAPPYTRGWVNGACGDSGLSGFPPPQDFPPGGQCPEFYTVDYVVTSSNGIVLEREGDVQGPVLNMYLGGAGVLFDTTRGNPPTRNTFLFDSAGPYASLDIRSITLRSGGIDDCGNSPDYYVPDPPKNANDFSISVTHQDNSTTIYKSNTNIGGNTSISFTSGGTSINVTGDGVFVEQDNDPDTGGKKAPPPGGTTTDFVPSPNNEDFVVSPPPGVEEDEEIEDVEVEDEEIDWVLVDITTFPTNGKSILQKDPENNDYFAGYFSWILAEGNGYWLGQQPLRKQFSAFKAPDNITGYRIYAVNGAKLSVRQYVQIIPAEE